MKCYFCVALQAGLLLSDRLPIDQSYTFTAPDRLPVLRTVTLTEHGPEALLCFRGNVDSCRRRNAAGVNGRDLVVKILGGVHMIVALFFVFLLAAIGVGPGRF